MIGLGRPGVALIGLAAGAVLFLGAPGASADPAAAARLRHLGFAINDAPPSPEEAQRFAAGEVTLDALVDTWLGGERHRARIKRFFYDLFGTQDFAIISANHVLLKKNALGIYKLPDKTDCSPTDAAEVGAWWLEPGQTVRVCNNSLSQQVEFGPRGQPGYWSCTYPNGMEDPRCGCGSDLLLCAPEEKTADMARASYFEFVERGLWAYENGRSWMDLLAANLFYGTRWEYYLYLWHGWMSPFGELPSAADIARLKSLPLDRRGVTLYPESGAERAPVATGVNFMVQYNNFRSRIRILSERLLCQPITGALNTDGIQTFVNQDLTEADRSHGTKAPCSGCHYALDNLGSTLLGWNDLGFYDGHTYSQQGHAFGQGGKGPRFLMQSFVERGPGFQECMARRAWEGFSGLTWSRLTPSEQQSFLKLVPAGPRALFQGVLTSSALKRMR